MALSECVAEEDCFPLSLSQYHPKMPVWQADLRNALHLGYVKCSVSDVQPSIIILTSGLASDSIIDLAYRQIRICTLAAI